MFEASLIDHLRIHDAIMEFNCLIHSSNRSGGPNQQKSSWWIEAVQSFVWSQKLFRPNLHKSV